MENEVNQDKLLKEMEAKVEAKEKRADEEVSKKADEEFREEEENPEVEVEKTEAEKIVDSWVPKTALGREVKSGKIKSIEGIFKSGRKIMEPEIVDKLLDVKTDLIFIGQSKGKFGGGKRRAWRQTQKKTEEGNVLTFSVLAVAGNEDGYVGIGYGRASETLPAKEKAIRKAKMNIRKIIRGCSSYDCSCKELHSIPITTEGKCSSVRVKLIPAPQGTGLVVGDELKRILKLAGIKDVYSVVIGKTQTTLNTSKACMEALDKLSEVQI